MTPVVDAFMLGVVSAASLGFGALTARLWKPTNFILGLFTAFGAGALLSAVTIDIVAPSVEHGDFAWLAVGAVLGGLAFEGSNRVINARGGFLRKASTSITFLRDREQRRRRAVFDDLERIDVFDGLPDRELDEIARAFRTVRLDAGEALYESGDPCDHLNVLVDGEVLLTTPESEVTLRPHQAFGHLAFVSGTSHRSTAVASTESEVLRLGRTRLRSVLRNCPEFADRMHRRARSDDVVEYVRRQHPEIGEAAFLDWMQTIDDEGIDRLPLLVEADVPSPSEVIVEQLADIGPFRGLGPRVLEPIARLMFREEHELGFVFFRPGEASERMYIVEDGDVAIVEATQESDLGVLYHAGEEFGSLSFFTGMPHTATAIAQSQTEVWVLRRADLEELLVDDRLLQAAISKFLASPRVSDYLEIDHEMEREKVSAIRRRALARVRKGRLPAAVTSQVTAGAPIAIWLGLLLDAIPESLVIGATAGAIRRSFIVGIFLSNYPEALASSVGMREQGYRWRLVSTLWGSVILVTGMGAAIGSVVFQTAPEQAFAIVEGLAAGAMLTVITQTMMPEALHRSGGFVGLAALGGFLVTTIVGV